MQPLAEELSTLLQQDERLVGAGKLLKNKVVELALQLDARLLGALLGHPRLRSHFFQQVGEVWVFDKVKFQQFVDSRSFLPDSYTAFRNKISLWQPDTYLASRQEVVLAWPYKDCVLEGGQTKDDHKRNELFWNEILAPEQIDRLLAPKCFTNFKKYDQNGVSVPEQLRKNDNLIIKGNNLLVLHSLKKAYRGQVKLIYIDPPYNTGSDSFLYNDRFQHATWLTFMKNRLEVAWELLAENGSIWIQVDDTELAYLKVLCDEIFGREHFRENIVLKSSTESGVNAINVKRGERLFKVKEHILFYAKSTSFRFRPFYTKTEYNLNYKYEVKPTAQGYSVTDMAKEFFEKYAAGRKKKDLSEAERMVIQQSFIEYALSHPAHIYSLEKNIKKAGEKFKKFAEANQEKGMVEPFINSAGEEVLVYDGGVLVPLKERIVMENGKPYFGVLASDLWVDIGTTPSNEGGVAFNNGKKPEKLLRRIIEMTTNEQDLVLDYHLGSGTTAAVAHKLNRRYIGIEQMDYGENDSVARLRQVIGGEASGISKSVGWQGGGSFVFMELRKSNQRFAERILEAENAATLAETVGEMMASGFVHHQVDRVAWQQSAAEFDRLPLDEQKKCALALLDLNDLYLPYSEMMDEDHCVSPQEQSLNQQFYGMK